VNADAVVRALAETQVAARAAADVEVIGALELALVAVRGLEQQEQALTALHLHTADFEIA
jgi:hypothetical protein